MGENSRAFPTAASKPPPKQLFLVCKFRWNVEVVVRKSEMEHRTIITKRKPPNLLANFSEHNIGKFIPRPISVGNKCRDFETQVFLKSSFGPEGKFANP